MAKLKIPVLQIFLIHFIFAAIFIFTTNCFADTAKEKYMEADACYKKLRHSVSKQKKEIEWLNCISRYEIIYRLHNNSSWAPAGMYKAAELYIALSKRSGRGAHQRQAADLLARLQNKYPKSSYVGRSKTLLKKITVTPRYSVKKIHHIKSKKKLTINDDRIRKYTQNRKTHTKKQAKPSLSTIKKPVAVETDSYNKKHSYDTTVTELRFWSNPDYTRIVINAKHERDYTHRLLKKDPGINKPFQRLYIDIDQTKLGQGIAEHTPINDNLLKQARAGQHLPHSVRVVVDFKSFKNYKIFSLKDPFRIVIDVWGKGSNGKKDSSSLPKTAGLQKGEKISRLSTDNLKSSDIARQLALGVRKIVIDPGHGGGDPGAPGYYKNVWEKDIVLKLAKKLARELKKRLNCTVLLTRSTDKRLTLEERTAIANTKRADLFISLHVNAAKNRKLRGIETYILNLATDKQAIAVAARENATSEKNISDLDLIISDLMQNTKIEESTRLANLVQNNFVKGMRKKYSGINNLGVKQAPFYVLLGARMPSILIETSFISNKKECKRLMSDSYQSAIASTITDGIEKYINETNPKQL